MPGYPPEEPLVPHGVSVIVNAPSVFRFTAGTSPSRHLDAAAWLGADVRGAREEDAGEILAGHLASLMSAASVPAGLADLGYGEPDLDALVAGTIVQTRLLDNAPRSVGRDELAALFRGALGHGKTPA
jgi:alcohol dehydrogenase class IV